MITVFLYQYAQSGREKKVAACSFYQRKACCDVEDFVKKWGAAFSSGAKDSKGGSRVVVCSHQEKDDPGPLNILYDCRFDREEAFTTVSALIASLSGGILA